MGKNKWKWSKWKSGNQLETKQIVREKRLRNSTKCISLVNVRVNVNVFFSVSKVIGWKKKCGAGDGPVWYCAALLDEEDVRGDRTSVGTGTATWPN